MSAQSAQDALTLDSATMRFGGITAVSEFDMALPQGLIAGLIGPNGAGKTTVFNMITGFYTPTRGDILFQGKAITGRPPHRICKAGIARTFQNIRLFTGMSALQNVMVGGHLRQKSSWWMPPLQLPLVRREEKALRERGMQLLESLGLGQVAQQPAGSLPYGAQRRLEIARALATNPRLLLLDEPAAGMNPQESAALMDLIRAIRDEYDLTILLIEHDMKVVMGVCAHIWVLEYGMCIAEGDPDFIRGNPRVIEAYLGEEYTRHA
ncbi:ABC transporter ATP-binding protein [Desulfovibrio sp. OttesenSCG-928-M14]|nr:ABC transporter ATP-binding protein [Desulfovibrio sp. OttesenSCG-928-M14]